MMGDNQLSELLSPLKHNYFGQHLYLEFKGQCYQYNYGPFSCNCKQFFFQARNFLRKKVYERLCCIKYQPYVNLKTLPPSCL